MDNAICHNESYIILRQWRRRGSPGVTYSWSTPTETSEVLELPGANQNEFSARTLSLLSTAETLTYTVTPKILATGCEETLRLHYGKS